MVVDILLVMVSDGCSDDVLDALLLVLVMVSFCVRCLNCWFWLVV